MLLISQDPNTCFYCNSLKGLSVTRELSKKKESITVIYKNNKCEIIIIMNEIKLVIYKSGSWLERSSLTKSLLILKMTEMTPGFKPFTVILNMLTESVDLRLETFSNDDDNNNVKKQSVLREKQLLRTCITLFSTFLWRPLRREPPSATFYGGRGHTSTNFPFCIWTLDKALKDSTPGKVGYI